ncbi:MAG: hypothetical protein WCW35_12650 [Bacteroidota bacterium]
MIWKYVIAWFGMMFLAIVNGIVRDFVYKQYVGDLSAHQISTLTLLLLFAPYICWLMRRWKLQSQSQAWIIGMIWFMMTEIFEFGLGIRRGLSTAELLHAYNVLEGQIWILIPLWVLVAPYVFYRYAQFRKME